MVVKIVTDSTADLPPALAQEWGITVVPLYVHFGTETYRDGLDLGAEEFYQRLLSAPRLPTTSAPSPGTFTQVYSQLAQESQEILSLHISSKLSAAHSSALLGQQEVKGDCHIEVVDTLTVSMGLGLLALGAAQRAKEGANLYEIADWVHHTAPHTHLFGLLDTLEYVHKGGRIGKAQAFLGGLLKIKPIVAVKEGEVHPVERVRSHSRGVEKLVEMVARLPGVHSLAVIYSTGEAARDELVDKLKPLAPQGQLYSARFGPVLGTYVGPGALGVACIEKPT